MTDYHFRSEARERARARARRNSPGMMQEGPTVGKVKSSVRSFGAAALQLQGIEVTFEEVPGGVRAIGADRRFRGRRLEAFGATERDAEQALARMVVSR